MAQSLAWGADLLPSPRVALGVSLAIALQVASASMEGAWLPLLAPREKGQGGALSPLGRCQGGACPWGWLSACWRWREKSSVAPSRDGVRVCPLVF